MFESGNRVQDTLADLAGIMGARDAAICREMTKMHEEVRRAPVSELARAVDTLETRGEFVLVIGPPAAGAQIMTEHELDDLLRSSLERDSVKDAVAHAVELSGRPRREIYARALELAKELDKRADKRAGAEGDDGKDCRRPTRHDAGEDGVARARRGVSNRAVGREPRHRVSDGKGLSHPRQTFSHALWRDRHRGAPAQSAGLCRGQGSRQPG
jgi:hypothetical protein